MATLAGVLGAIVARQTARAPSSVETITSSERMLAELERLIDDGEEDRQSTDQLAQAHGAKLTELRVL